MFYNCNNYCTYELLQSGYVPSSCCVVCWVSFVCIIRVTELRLEIISCIIRVTELRLEIISCKRVLYNELIRYIVKRKN